MAKIEKLINIYVGPALNTAASNVLRLPSITGTITEVYFDASEVTDGDLELALYEDGVLVSLITVADTTANENVTGLSFSSTLGKVLSLSLLSPIPDGVPAPPWSLIVTVEVTETHVALTGAQTVAGVKTFSSSPIVPTPSGTTDAANKAYVDNSVAGLSWKQAVRVATTADGTFASAYDNASTVDGVSLATGDRILIKNQSDATTNGIYIVAASGAPTRATDADSAAEILQASVYVQEGTTLADTQWVNTTNAPITLGATNIVFAQLSSGSGSVATDAIFDAKGDLPVGTGANTAAKLTVGANDTMLMAASGETTGQKWATPSEIRTALALVIGTNTQAWDTLLDLIAALSDPNADKILFWDDSAGAFAWLEPATNLAITGTDLAASGGSSDFDTILTNNDEVLTHLGFVLTN